MSDWRTRAKPIGQTPYAPNLGSAADLPVEAMSESDVLQSIDPGNWRNRAVPIDREGPKEMFGPANPIQGNNAGAGKAFAYGVTGGQVPFGNRITSAIGATMANAADGLGAIPDTPWKELYRQSLADTKATQEANPGATLGGNVLGAVSTLPIGFSKAIVGQTATTGVRGAVNAIPKVTTAIGNFARSGKAAKDASTLAKAGSLALRSGKSAIVAAPVGALYAAGEADPGDMLGASGRGAGVAAGIGASLPIAGATALYGLGGLKNVRKGIGARGTEALSSVGQSLNQKSTQAYNKMREVGAIFTPEKSRQIASDLQRRLISDGPINERLHDKTISVFKDIESALVDGGDVSLESLDQWRQLLGEVAGDFRDKSNRRKAKILMKTLDEAVNSTSQQDLKNGSREAVEALNEGRKAYTTARKFEAVQNILRKADGDPNKIKSALKRFLDDPKKTQGWSPAEVMALQDAARYTAGEGVIKALGKFGFDLGTSQTMGNTALPVLSGGAAAASLGSGVGAAVPIVGTAARQTQKYLARGKADELLRVIEAGGKVSQKQIMSLPPKQAKALLAASRGMGNTASRLAALERTK